jgi:hypothetical protein
VPESYTVKYEITPAALLDAVRLHQTTFLARARAALAVIVLAGLAITVVGDPKLGLSVAIFGLLMLGLTWVQFLDRWLIGNRGRGMIGETSEYVIDDGGIHYTHTLGSGDLPWSALTTIRANERSIVFGRDRVLAAYIPTSSFSSSAERDAFIAFARAHVSAGTTGA